MSIFNYETLRFAPLIVSLSHSLTRLRSFVHSFAQKKLRSASRWPLAGETVGLKVIIIQLFDQFI